MKRHRIDTEVASVRAAVRKLVSTLVDVVCAPLRRPQLGLQADRRVRVVVAKLREGLRVRRM